MSATTGTADQAANEIANAGHKLYRILRDCMTDEERAELDLLFLAVADLRITSKWDAAGIEVAVGIITGDGQGLVVETFKTPRTASPAGAEH